MARRKQIKQEEPVEGLLRIKKKELPPCPYPFDGCERSMAGMCCSECDRLFTCADACQNNTANEPMGCGRFMKGKKRNVK